MPPIHELSAVEIARRVRARELTTREVATAFLDRTEGLDGAIHAFLRLDRDAVLREADEVQRRLEARESLPLAGVPVALKDNLSTEGIETTCASRILEGYIPPYDATVVERLREAGAIAFGKTNLDEFAMGTSCENSAFGPTDNPWELGRSPGGSSGGSAAAVAAGFAPVALGSDTGGSVRMPAAVCGIVGYKPTYGRISRYGLVAFASSLDQIGPFGASVADVAELSRVISGRDERDATSLPTPIEAGELANSSLSGRRFAVPEELMGEGIQSAVRKSVEAAIVRMKDAGATVETISLPSIALGVSTYYIIAPAEASSNLARFDGIRFGPRLPGEGQADSVARTRGQLFGNEVKARIMIGTYVLSAGYYDAYFLKAMRVRAQLKAQFEEALGRFDGIVSPASPVVAFRLGALRDDPMALKLLDLCTIPANLGGFPAISIPCGFASDGDSPALPVGLQILGRSGEDEALLRDAAAVERALPEAQRRAPLSL